MSETYDFETIKRMIVQQPPIGTRTGPRQRALLFDLARNCGGHVIETGTGAGGTAIVMGLALLGSPYTVMTYDPFPVDPDAHDGWTKESQAFREERLRTNHRIYRADNVITVKASAKAYYENPYNFFENDPPLIAGLVFIDGDHRERAVREDVEWTLPKLKIGGFLALHDCGLPGVKPVGDEFRWKRPAFKLVHEVNGLLVFEKLSDEPAPNPKP